MLKKWMMGLAAGAIALAGATVTNEARAENVLKMGSLAPSQSPWAQVLNVWKRAVNERTNGEVKVRFYWNGTQGDEANMVEKVNTGQLHGVMVTAVGLSKIHKPILSLQMPGVFSSWAQLDRARTALQPEFEAGANAKGFTIMGWGDVGKMHWYSKGFEITNPASLAGKKPYVWSSDSIHTTLFGAMAGVTPVPLGVPEVLPALNSNRVDAAHTPALTCGQLQWISRFDHMVIDSHAYMIGAVALSTSALGALSEDHRKTVIDTGKMAASELTTRIRAEDDAALERQKKRTKARNFTASEKAEWEALYARVRQRLGENRVFQPKLIADVEKHGRGR